MIDIKIKIIISWGLVLSLVFAIYYFSNMDENESNSKSKETIGILLEKSMEVSNGTETTNENNNQIKKLIRKYNIPFRKVAHVCEYCVLTILLIIAFKSLDLNGKKLYILSLILCVIYACIDEFHQTFVNGRTGQFTDVIIDTLGGLMGCILAFIIKKLMCKSTKNPCK